MVSIGHIALMTILSDASVWRSDIMAIFLVATAGECRFKNDPAALRRRRKSSRSKCRSTEVSFEVDRSALLPDAPERSWRPASLVDVWSARCTG